MPGMVQSLTREECLARLSLHKVGRVSVSKHALPVIVPVTYVQDGSDIVFYAPLDAGFTKVCDRAVIAFEVDGLSATGDSGWSVHVVGVARLVDDTGRVVNPPARVDLERLSGRGIRSVSGHAPRIRHRTGSAEECEGPDSPRLVEPLHATPSSERGHQA